MHQGAINMGNVPLQAEKHDSFRSFSRKMMVAQQMEIQQLSALGVAETVIKLEIRKLIHCTGTNTKFKTIPMMMIGDQKNIIAELFNWLQANKR